MANLGVNIDHVATIRQARKADEPDPVWAAVEAELGGADCITVHLREDRRHINDRDVILLKHTVAVKLNLEMSINSKIVQIAQEVSPDQCTLVPENRQEITTEGGLNVVKLRKNVGLAVKKLHQSHALVSAFIEPMEDQIKTSADLGFDAIELWTGGYSHTEHDDDRQKALAKLQKGVELGLKLGLVVHGGHGLTYRNIEPVARIPGFSEFNIGHTIIARSVFVGLRQAVKEMKELLIRFQPQTQSNAL